MAALLRHFDSLGYVKERFVGVVHVTNTSSKSPKSSIDSLFSKHGLSLNQLRGQGFNGESNMRVVVDVATKHDGVSNFFEMTGLLTNVVCVSCKRKDMLHEGYKKRVEEAIGNNEIETGMRLNQEFSLIRVGDTRWGFHYKTMASLVSLYPEVLDVLEYVQKEGDNANMRGQEIGLTETLFKLFKRKDQNILEAVSLVRITTKKLQKSRHDRFKDVLEQVYEFCEKHEIDKLDMAENYVHLRNRRTRTDINNRRYFQIDI